MMPESLKPKVIAGMPAYNEEKYIGTLVLHARRYVDQVLVVDDGSSDNTADIAGLAGAEVLRHPKNLGYGAAIRSLLAEARKRDADVLVILDADSQHDPGEIPKLVGSVREGYDFVIGSRQGQAARIPFYRRVGQKVIQNSLSVLSGKGIKDSECGFRAFSKRALHTLELKENGMAVSAETIAEATRCNLKVAQVPVSVTYHKESSTLNPLAHGLGVLTRILVMISEQKPLFFFGLAGLVMMLAGIIAGIFAIRLYTESGVVSVPWSLVAGFLMILGAVSFFNGLMLHAMANIIRSAIARSKQ